MRPAMRLERRGCSGAGFFRWRWRDDEAGPLELAPLGCSQEHPGYNVAPPLYERANTRFWAKFIDEKCVPAIFKACWGEDQKERERAAEELSKLLQFLENELKGKRFFGGQTIGLLDIAANMIGYGLGVFEEAAGVSELLTKEKFPKLFNWANEFLSVSAIKEHLPPRDKHVAYMRKRFGMVNASK